MFDITSSKLFLLAIVALLVIGPKDFPVLLRTIGKYVGIIRGHANEFLAQFDEAMRESELEQLKKDMENIARETEASLNDTGRSVETTFDDARRSVETTVTDPVAPAAEPAGQVGEPAPGKEPSVATTIAETTVEAPPAVAPEPATTVAAPAAAEPAPSAQPAVERTGA
jgi:sec-independent protein translocase protein TatB